MNKMIRAERDFISNQPYFSGLRKEVNLVCMQTEAQMLALRGRKTGSGMSAQAERIYIQNGKLARAGRTR